MKESVHEMYISKSRTTLIFIILCAVLGLLSYLNFVNIMLAYFFIIFVLLLNCFILISNLSKSELRNLIYQQKMIWFLLIVLFLAQVINSIEGELTLNDAVKVSLFPLTFLYTCSLVPAFLIKFSFERIFLKSLIYPGIILSVFTIIACFLKSTIYGGLNLTSLQAAQFYTIHSFFDSNYQGAVVAISTVICIYFLLEGKGNRGIYLCFLLLNISNLIVLASRASLLAVAICILLSIFIYGSKKIKVILLFSFLIIGCLQIFNIEKIRISPVVYHNILDAERGSTGRIQIWYEILQISSKRLFTGYGNNNLEFKSLGPYEKLSSSHNSFLDFLAINGAFALIVYVLVLVIAFWKSSLLVKQSPLFLLLVCIFILMNFTTHNLGGVSYVPQVLGILLGLSFMKKF